MSEGISKRTQQLLARMEKAGGGAEPELAGATSAASLNPAPVAHGRPGLLKEFEHMDRSSLAKLGEFERKYAGGAALPCLTIDPNQVSTGGFFNRFEEAFDAAKDKAFRELVDSIRTTGGNLEPGLVRPTPEAERPYELIYGERRLRACRLAGVAFKTVVGVFTDELVAQLHAHENSHREDPSVVESALQLNHWFVRLGRSRKGEGEIAARVGEIFGYTNRHASRLRDIAQVPVEYLAKIPGVRRLSVRQGLALAKAWKADEAGVRERFDRLLQMSALLPKDAIAFLTDTSPTPSTPGQTHAQTITVAWPSDRRMAVKLRQRLRDIEKEFGISIEFPQKNA